MGCRRQPLEHGRIVYGRPVCIYSACDTVDDAACVVQGGGHAAAPAEQEQAGAAVLDTQTHQGEPPMSKSQLKKLKKRQ